MTPRRRVDHPKIPNVRPVGEHVPVVEPGRESLPELAARPAIDHSEPDPHFPGDNRWDPTGPAAASTRRPEADSGVPLAARPTGGGRDGLSPLEPGVRMAPMQSWAGAHGDDDSLASTRGVWVDPRLAAAVTRLGAWERGAAGMCGAGGCGVVGADGVVCEVCWVWGEGGGPGGRTVGRPVWSGGFG